MLLTKKPICLLLLNEAITHWHHFCHNSSNQLFSKQLNCIILVDTAVFTFFLMAIYQAIPLCMSYIKDIWYYSILCHERLGNRVYKPNKYLLVFLE